MPLLFVVGLLLVFFLLVISLVILRFHSRQIEKRTALLSEAFWARRNIIPLLLEVATQENSNAGFRQQIIETRAKLCSDAYTLEEKVVLEKELTDLLDKILKMPEDKEVPLKKNVLFFSLKQEFHHVLSGIRIALNDYNFAIQRFARFCQIPPLNMLVYLFKVRKRRVLPLL